jgi:hypothetical protein
MGEDEWNKLSDSEKQKKIVELKMKERKLRQEGNVEEAAAIFEKVLENDECKTLTERYKCSNSVHVFACSFVRMMSVCTILQGIVLLLTRNLLNMILKQVSVSVQDFSYSKMYEFYLCFSVGPDSWT